MLPFPAPDRPFAALALGELLECLMTQPGEQLRTTKQWQSHLGGTEANVMAALIIFGHRTGLITAVPKDEPIGDWAIDELRRLRVSDDYAVRRPGARLGMYRMAPGFAPNEDDVRYDRGNTAFLSLTPDDIPDSASGAAQVFHTSGVTLALSQPIRDLHRFLLEKMKRTGTLISVDFNYRNKLWGPQGGETAAKAVFERVLPQVDYFNLAVESAQKTFGIGESAPEMICRRLYDTYGVPVLSLTNRQGDAFQAYMYEGATGTFAASDAYMGLPRMGRTGSGDAFVAGVLGALLRGDGPKAAIDYGAAFAAIKCTLMGDVLQVSLSQVERLMLRARGGVTGDTSNR